MSFDGIPRPSQWQAYTDPLGPYVAANEAAEEARRRPRIKKNREAFSLDEAQKELAAYHDHEDEEQHEGLTEEEREQVLVFAKLRGLMNISLEQGILYKFHFNEQTGLVDLVDEHRGTVVLTLTPDELMQLSRQVQRYAGMMTDRSA